MKSYNNTAHNISEINLILPQIPKKQKCGMITMLVSSFIGLAYEGISSFLHHKRTIAFHKPWIVKPLSNAKVNAARKFNVDVWHLQCRNIRKVN